jgi:hypothetical protein
VCICPAGNNSFQAQHRPEGNTLLCYLPDLKEVKGVLTGEAYKRRKRQLLQEALGLILESLKKETGQ